MAVPTNEMPKMLITTSNETAIDENESVYKFNANNNTVAVNNIPNVEIAGSTVFNFIFAQFADNA